MASTPSYLTVYSTSSMATTTFNTTTNTTSNETSCPPEATADDTIKIIFVGVVFFLILIIGTIGNSMILLMIVTDKSLRKSVINHYIFNLGVADLMLTLLWFPESVFGLMGNGWPMGLAMCKIYRFLLVTFLYVSIITLIAVCVERYIAIVHPFHIARKLNSVNRVRFAIATIWIVAMATASPTLPFQKLIPHQCVDVVICNFVLDTDEDNTHYIAIFGGIQFGLYFLVPLSIQVILYGLITKRLCEKQHRVTHHRGTIKTENNSTAMPNGGNIVPIRQRSNSSEVSRNRSNSSDLKESETPRHRAPSLHFNQTGKTSESETSLAGPYGTRNRSYSNNLNRNETPKRETPRHRAFSLHFRETWQTSESGTSPTGPCNIRQPAKSEVVRQIVDVTRMRHGVIRMLVACVVIHFVSYLPIQVYYFMGLGGYGVPIPDIAHVVGIISIHINSAANPIIYFIFSQYYRKKFKRMCRWCFCRGRVSKSDGYSPRTTSNGQRFPFQRWRTSTTAASTVSSPDTPLMSPVTSLPPVFEPEPAVEPELPHKLYPKDERKFHYS